MSGCCAQKAGGRCCHCGALEEACFLRSRPPVFTRDDDDPKGRVMADLPFPGAYLEAMHGGVTVRFVRTRHEYTKDGVTFVWWGMQPKELAQ